MIQSKQKVKDLCDKLMMVNPYQIVIDFVQDDIEEVLEFENVTPDDIGALAYQCDNILQCYNDKYEEDILFLLALKKALSDWLYDAEFANKTLGLDPNK